MIAVIDNYDSFTYNLVQYLGELGTDVVVYRNDAVTVDDLLADKPQKLLISPGPCTPDKAGVSLQVVKAFKDAIPIFGVCLGHQTLGQYFGGTIVRAQRVMHGKLSPIKHSGQGVFSGLPTPYQATRYHSLVIDPNSLPDCLEVTAWVDGPDDSHEVREIMGIRHKTLDIEGVQFHPESISSEHGHALLKNFVDGSNAVDREK